MFVFPNPLLVIFCTAIIKDDGTSTPWFPLLGKVAIVLVRSTILRRLHSIAFHNTSVSLLFRRPSFRYVLHHGVLPRIDPSNGRQLVDNIMSQIIPSTNTPTKYSASPHSDAQQTDGSTDSKNCKLCRKRLLNEHFYNPKTGLLFSVCDICRKRKRDKYWSTSFGGY